MPSPLPLSSPGLVPDRPRARAPAGSRWVLAVAMLAFFCLLTVAGWTLWSSHRNQLNEQAQSLQAIARTLSMHAQATLRQVDVALQDLAEQAADTPETAAGLLTLESAMRQQRQRLPMVRALSLFEAGGRLQLAVTASRPVALGPAAAPLRTSGSLSFGSPQRDSLREGWLLPLRRAIPAKDGRPGGMIEAILDLSYFQDHYQSLQLDGRGSVSLLREDGQLLLRYPPVPAGGEGMGSMAESVLFREGLSRHSAGSAHYRAETDGAWRLAGYARLPDYPVIALITMDRHSLLTDWRHAAAITGMLVALLSVVLFLMGLRVSSLVRSQRDAEQALRQTHSQLIKANEALAVLAREDGLTGLLNRRAFDIALRDEMQYARRQDSPLGLLFVDVDFFKRYNDEYGHPAGDACLRHVAELVGERVRRAGDAAARYGGEEFALILRGTDAAGARRVAEMLRQSVQDRGLPQRSSPLGVVTVSVGWAVMGPHENLAPEALLARADQALYRAKEEGRNRVCGQALA